MKQRKLTTKFWVKAMLWFLFIMFLFTILSRAAASFTVAQVQVDSPSARKLLYTVKAEGRIEKNREISVLCHSDILVKSVLVSEGQRVGKGELLARLDGANIREQIKGLQHKRQAYLLQNQEYQNNCAAINRINISEIDDEIGKLKKILRQKCRITAPKDGVITSILVNVGQRTLDTAMFTMTDDSAGLKFIGQIAIEDAKYVSVGDSITLKNENKTIEDMQIAAMEIDESKQYMNVMVLLPAKAFSLGETVTMVVEQESEAYSCTVPVTAVHQENNKYYVLLMENRDTVLGQQTVAIRMEVEVLEKNGQFAALESSALGDDIQVITDTDRYVAAGDRVRLKGE